ncbi:MAG: DUF1080 domain-containing protein [Acidobacteria bacterium]|nr:DUF1080 domain-containing protein [Acidobacteriota bacterium]
MTKNSLLVVALSLIAQPGHWESLFDGKTTTGWRTQSKPTFPSKSWDIEEGALHSIPAAPQADLSTARNFRNFECEFEWKIGKGANSGVKYLVFGMRPNPKVGYIDPEVPKALGLELQLIDDANVADARLAPSHATGALYLFKAAASVPNLPVGQWHRAKIVVNGRHVEHWLNAVKVLDADLESPEIYGAMKAQPRPDIPKPANLDELKADRKKAYPIVLTHHGGDAWYRNIRIRELH